MVGGGREGPALLGEQSIFVSYAREDRAFVERLVEQLRQRGVDVWLDSELRAGADWQRALEDSIRACGRMIVVLSPDSVKSHEVQSEWSLALEDGDLVVPVLCRTCDIPMRLRTRQWVDFREDWELAFEKLLLGLDTLPARTVTPLAHSTSIRPSGGLSRGHVRLMMLGTGMLFVAIGVSAFLWRGETPALTRERVRPAKVSAASLQTRPKATADAVTMPVAGQEMLSIFRTASDSRTRMLENSPRWRSAAASFEQAMLSASSEQEKAAWRARRDYCRGKAFLVDGDLSRAESAFQDSRRADTTFALPLLGLAGVYTRLGQLSHAHEAAQDALSLEPNFWLAQIAAGPIYAAEGKFHEAIQVYLDALDEKNPRPFVQGNLALAYHVSRQHDETALDLAQLALGRDPELAPALLVVAERRLEAHELEDALAASSRLVKTDLFDAAGWLVHGDVLLALGRRAEARSAFERALSEYDRTQLKNAPSERISVVRSALQEGQLPPPRLAGSGRATPAFRAGPARSSPKSGGKPSVSGGRTMNRDMGL